MEFMDEKQRYEAGAIPHDFEPSRASLTEQARNMVQYWSEREDIATSALLYAQAQRRKYEEALNDLQVD